MSEKEEHESRVIVEAARPEDAKAIVDIQLAGWLETYVSAEHGITRDDIEKRLGVNDSLFWQKKIDRWRASAAHQTKDKAVFVARVDRHVAGFSAPYRTEDGRFRPGAMYINPSDQGKGVGKKLFQHTLDFMGDGEIVVHVVSYNDRAINFYKSFGFEVTGPLPAGEGVDVLPSGAVIPELEMIRPALLR